MFIWLPYHGRLMTNKSLTPHCHCCPGEIEDLDHLFCFCHLQGSTRNERQSLNFTRWLTRNLERRGAEGEKENWKKNFAM